MEEELTIEQFREKLLSEAERFYKEWLAAEKREPGNYAHTMTESEWWEQHTAWSGMGEI